MDICELSDSDLNEFSENESVSSREEVAIVRPSKRMVLPRKESSDSSESLNDNLENDEI